MSPNTCKLSVRSIHPQASPLGHVFPRTAAPAWEAGAAAHYAQIKQSCNSLLTALQARELDVELPTIGHDAPSAVENAIQPSTVPLNSEVA